MDKVCSECGARIGHHPKCSLIDFEDAKRQLLQYYQLWLDREKINRKNGEQYAQWARQLRKLVSDTQGKMRIIQHENNQLRKKLFPQKLKGGIPKLDEPILSEEDVRDIPTEDGGIAPKHDTHRCGDGHYPSLPFHP